ncbi:hypothetical protein HJA76_09750 [Rhizobium bangladeshense]|uniref:Rap1a/Tai family immunity protein n=1 Tax=Rhizobium bangladeshense TaxID=1138189 RepID=UPI001C839C9D|nr:Rap1a/Tai family immunity protein [Rhizobium bangladeshense]MBX4919991.1 hypothetical protein [Rhizobium bangladeshense]
MRTFIIAALLVSMGGTAALSEDVSLFATGENITTACRAFRQLAQGGNQTNDAQVAYNAGRCLGQVEMVADFDAIHRSSIAYSVHFPKFCLPNGTNNGAIAEVVANYADSHPEQRSLAGYALIRRAMAVAWPCASNQ